jgi:flagellar motility protein MotE (MotC chaperone)
MRVRLLPVLLLVAGFALTARLGELWTGFGSLAQAQTKTGANAAAGTGTTGTGTTGTGTTSTGTTGTGTANTGGAAAAQSQAPSPTASGQPAQQTQQTSAGADSGSAPQTDPLMMSDEEINLLQELGDRRRELDRRERQIAEREALLAAAEHRLEEKVASLQKLQETIQASLQQRDGEDTAQIDSLVKIYESMKPKDAARIFDQLDMGVLMPVVERMKERKTAPILASMTPAKAREVTAELARRREAKKATP